MHVNNIKPLQYTGVGDCQLWENRRVQHRTQTAPAAPEELDRDCRPLFIISGPIARISVVAGPDGNLVSPFSKRNAERQHGPWHTTELRIWHHEWRNMQDLQLCPPIVAYLWGTRLPVKEAL